MSRTDVGMLASGKSIAGSLGMFHLSTHQIRKRVVIYCRIAQPPSGNVEVCVWVTRGFSHGIIDSYDPLHLLITETCRWINQWVVCIAICVWE